MEEQIQLFQPDFVVDFDGFGHTAAGRISGAVILKAGDGPSPDCPAVYLRNIPAMKLFLEGKPVAQSVYSLLQQKFNFLFSGKRIIVSGCSQEADAMLTILKGVNASVRSDVREQLVTLTRLMSGIRPVKPEEYGEADVLFIAGEGQALEINPENLKQEAIIFNMAGAGMEKRLRTHLRIERNLYDGKDDLCCRRYGEKRIYLYRDGADITADAFYDYPYEAADMIWSGILLSLRSLERGENAGTVRELELIIKLKIKALMGS